ncbi:MAG TPA: anti-sigma factor [Burkholderiales bacterium]|jgi:anti-sigma-K factor RskA|nr:anti-sigma factor [Burkholderiales bacterium]
MKLATHAALDALCGEYLLGALRGPARRRFDRALRDEPLVASRLRHWEGLAPRYSTAIEIQPSNRVWQRLASSLELTRHRDPWYRRERFWIAVSAAMAVVLVIAFTLQVLQQRDVIDEVEIALLSGKDNAPQVSAHRSRDGRTLMLRSTRPLTAGAAKSYELWVIPAEGGDPVSLAVLASLDARLAIPVPHAGRLKPGATLAVSVEPAGGSPTGKPTGPVILAGKIG